MPLFPLPALLSILINGLLLVLFMTSDWKTGICSALLLALGAPLYVYGRTRWRVMA